MPDQEEIKFKCTICGEFYSREESAKNCEESHNTIYVKLKKDDLFKLIQFLYTGDRSLLSESLMTTLLKYKKGSYR